jgi:hypothetical protein
MNLHVGSPARNRAEDRFLFIVMPLIVLDGMMAYLGFHHFHLQPSGLPAFLCALLMASPLVAFILIYGLYLSEEKDEFLRAIQVQSMLWSIGITLTVTSIWGPLEKFHLVPHLEITWLQFLFMVPMAIANAVNHWRNR